MYGSNFCSRTRRPRCSSNMPIDAQVRPLPRELTTPPVTKICLVCRKGGVMSASSPPVPLFAKTFAQLPKRLLYPVPASPAGRGSQGEPSRGVGALLSPVFLDEPLVVLVSVNAGRGASDEADMDAPAQRQDAQLFQFFQLLQRLRRQRGEAEEERPAVGIQAEVNEEARRFGGEVGL